MQWKGAESLGVRQGVASRHARNTYHVLMSVLTQCLIFMFVFDVKLLYAPDVEQNITGALGINTW